MPLTATCHCGAVRITLPTEAAGVLACHCGDCQKMHGNFNAFLAAPIADIALQGGDALTWYQSSEFLPPRLLPHLRRARPEGGHPRGPLAHLRRPDRRANGQAHYPQPLGTVETRLVRPPAVAT